MKAFDWDALKTDKMAIHCHTDAEARQFLAEARNAGIKWASGLELRETHWTNYGKDTAYIYLQPSEFHPKGLQYAPVQLFESKGIAVFDWSNYIHEKEPDEIERD